MLIKITNPLFYTEQLVDSMCRPSDYYKRWQLQQYQRYIASAEIYGETAMMWLALAIDEKSDWKLEIAESRTAYAAHAALMALQIEDDLANNKFSLLKHKF